METPPEIMLGTAAWAIPKLVADQFGPGESILTRYAKMFPAVEINTSFYRPHQPATYKKWADSTPESFRFSVKIPKAISHEARLIDCDRLLQQFMHGAGQLGTKLGCLLLQLPPSFRFDASVAPFLKLLRQHYSGALAIEPRHTTWWQDDAHEIMRQADAAIVLGHPGPHGTASIKDLLARPFSYLRLHGSPKVYWSNYEDEFLDELANALKHQNGRVWCIFDNTATGAATVNALAVRTLLQTT